MSPSPGDAPESPENAKLGLARGDVLLAVATSMGTCGLLLAVFMNQADPASTYAHLFHLSEYVGLGTTPQGLVGLVMLHLALGLFVIFLAARSRTPPVKLEQLPSAPPSERTRFGCAVALGLALGAWGLLSWLSVAAGS